jgi:hypothetical protein
MTNLTIFGRKGHYQRLLFTPKIYERGNSCLNNLFVILAVSQESVPMKGSIKPIMFWTPRILTVLFAIFISLFAFDVFGEGYSFWETVLALFMHLIPTAIILLVLVVAWRWEQVGGILFIALGLLYLVDSNQHWSSYVIISGPLFVVGILFLLDWWYTPNNNQLGVR